MVGRAERVAIAAMTGALLALPVPFATAAHSELVSSTPADGEVVPPFPGLTKPIVLVFSEPLAEGSKAEWIGTQTVGEGGGSIIPILAEAVVDGPAGTMTIDLGFTLGSGDVRIEWTSVAEDGHELQGTIAFRVGRPLNTFRPSPANAATSQSTSAAASQVSGSPIASASPDAGASSGSGPGALLIVVGLLLAGAGVLYLLMRRKRAAT